MLKPNIGTIFVKKITSKKGTIIIPDCTEEKQPVLGEVTTICEHFVQNNVLLDQYLKVGDKVVFNPQYAVEFEIGSDKFTMVYMNQILAYEEIQ